VKARAAASLAANLKEYRQDISMSLTIRDAVPADKDRIAEFNSRMAVETEGRRLDEDIIGPGVATLIDDATKGRYWVAEQDGKIVGQIMITYEWSDWRNGTLWWIQSVYVHTNYRRQGVYSALYHHVRSIAEAEPDVGGIRLYVENDNKRAQRTYEALGMVDPGYRVMEAIFDHGTS
jgi:ribosomal protein S18 acetylase RimI-like enzyme